MVKPEKNPTNPNDELLTQYLPEITQDIHSIITRYLPDILIEGMNNNPNQPNSWIHPIEGSLLLADISGFTSMSEKLTEAGKEGAEWLTNIISEYFQSMLDIAYKRGGTNIKFGGDALLIIFQGKNHASHAIAAAQSMQSTTSKLKSFRVDKFRFKLKMTIGIHSGLFLSAVAGIPKYRMQHFMLGQAASQTAKIQALATAGELVISNTTFRLVNGLCVTSPLEYAYKVLSLTRRIPLPKNLSKDKPVIKERLKQELLPYLPELVIQSLQSDSPISSIEGEHRKIYILFIHLDGIDEIQKTDGSKAILYELQKYVSLLLNLTTQYEGYLIGNDISTSGLKLIVIFGAPIAHELDSANALRLAMELRKEVNKLNLRIRHRIGINSGYVFTGDVGTEYSQQYTVMGDAVNLAARLMSSSSFGQILVSSTTVSEAGMDCITQKIPAISVKGKKQPVPVCLLKAEKDASKHREKKHNGIIGRESEINKFQSLCREIESGKGYTLAVTGEAGIGKSYLMREFQDYVNNRDWIHFIGSCFSYTLTTPFAPWVQILNSFFSLNPQDTSNDKTKKVISSINTLNPNLIDISSLLNPLLGLNIPQSDIVLSLDDTSRRKRLFQLIAELVLTKSRDKPIAVFIEDLHWADHSTLELISLISSKLKLFSILFCLTYRVIDDFPLALDSTSSIDFKLGEMSLQSSKQIIKRVVGEIELPDHVVELIVSKSKGNPLFLEEIALSLDKSGILERLMDSTSFKIEDDLGTIEIPDRIQTLIMARIDTLPATTKDILRTAAVIGYTFDSDTLQTLLSSNLLASSLDAELQELIDADYIFKIDSVQGTMFQFRQVLIQEVGYNSLLFSRRRLLHHQVASHLEEVNHRNLESVFESLVHHYNLSRATLKTRLYSVKAAEKARQVFAHQEAIGYYNIGLKTLPKQDITQISERSSFLERIGDCFEDSGRHKEAVRYYSQALNLWNKVLRQKLPVTFTIQEFIAESLPKIRKNLLQHKMAASYERNSDYDLAKKYLRIAFNELPPRQPLQSAKIANSMCLVLFREGQYKEAIQWGRHGLSLSKRVNDRQNIAYSYNMLATSYLDLGKINKAIRYRQSAVQIYEELGNLSGQAEANNNLGICYQSLGDQDKALNYFRISLTFCERIGNSSNIAIAQNNVGEVLLIKDEVDEAINHLQKVVDTYEKTGEPVGCAGLALINIARSYQRKKEMKIAREYLDRGIQILRKAGATIFVLEAQLQQAELYLDESQIKDAMKICQKAHKDAEKLDVKLLQVRALHILGRINIAQNKYEQAETYLKESISLATRFKTVYEKGVALLALAMMYAKLAQESTIKKSYRSLLQRAVKIFRKTGAKADLNKALKFQKEYSL